MTEPESQVLERPAVRAEHFDNAMKLATTLLVLSDSLQINSPERQLLEDLGCAISRALEVSQRAPQ